MQATPRPKHQATHATLAADVAASAAVIAVPGVVANAIPSEPTSGAVVGMSALVTKKVKASKKSALVMLDKSVVH
jgi:hypothetical protein